jgi:PEP-CTERM motif
MNTSWKLRATVASALLSSAALVSTPALADTTNGYGVGTAARALDVYSFVPFTSAFRVGANSSGFYTQVGDFLGDQINTGCAPFGPEAVCSGGISGTTGTDYNLTASHSAAGRSSWGGNVQTTASASARADLATGQLGVVAVSDHYAASLSGFPTYNQGQAFAHLNDTLTFTVAGASASTVTLIGVELLLNGSLGITDARGGGNVQSVLNFGTAAAQFTGQVGAGSLVVSETHSAGGWASSNWDILLNGDLQPTGAYRFTGVYALTGASSVIGLRETLSAYAGGSAAASFGSTSHLAFTLPEGVSYTSNSEVFLSAVPEPGTWALMMAGLGSLGFLVRRRRA